MGHMKAIARPVLLGSLLVTSPELLAQRPTGSSSSPLPSPVLTIGREGDPDYEFVSVEAAYRLPTGGIAVADSRTPFLRVFDEEGRLLRKLGREGAGPGEFRSVHTLLVAGDTLLAYDWNLRRITRYLATGRLLGTQPVRTASDYGSVNVVGRLPTGRWLVSTPHAPNWGHGPGMYRDTLHVGSVDSSSTGPVRWIGHFPGATLFAFMPGQDKSRWAVGWAFFAPITVVGVVADTIIIGDTSTADLQNLSSDGRVIRRLTIPLDGAPDLTEHRRAALAQGLAHAGPRTNTEYVRASYEAARTPVHYRDFVVATDGHLWVRLFEQRPGDPVPYLILSPAGSARARVSLPSGGRVLSADQDWILCVLPDADDVERIGLVRWAVP